MSIPKADFTEAFIRVNGLVKGGFAAWVFHADMLFGAKKYWWGAKKQRPGPHEGIDLCLFRDGNGKIICIDERTNVPSAYDGTVVKILDDFLGKSILIEHVFRGDGRSVFLTIYGHTVPSEGLSVGESVNEGQVIATVASRKGVKPHVPPHLHLTIGRSTRPILYEGLDWTTISAPERLQLVDPLNMIDGARVIIDRESAPWESPKS